MAAGTLSVTNNSKEVVGVGTTFTAFTAGDFLTLVVGQVPYTVAIASVESDTALTLVLPFDGPTATDLAWDGVKRDTMSLATMGVTVQAQKALRLMIADENNWRAIFGDEEEVTVTLPNGQVMQGMSWGYLSQLLKEVDPVEMRNLQQQAAASEAAAQGFRNEAEDFKNAIDPTQFMKKSQNLADVADKSSARANLGVGDDSNVKHATLRLNGGESLVFNDVERNGLVLSNVSYGADSWVGFTMHKWYADWVRAGIVRSRNTQMSDYRIHTWKDGVSEALFRFMPDQRLISGNSGNPSVNEFQKAPLSDRDLKKEIQYTDGEESYNRVRQWLPAMFKYKESDVQRYGLIAQDLARIDPEYVHLLPGYAIYEDVKGVDEEGNEVVVDRKEIGYTDDVLSLDSNVLLMDLCAAFVHLLHKVEKLEGK
ncbi:putative tail tip protein [Escherichia phage mckay]|uniref:Putative tail tip protein n=1 Tax=Escherichia phage mckay TaxID=2696416 RepID=A0A6B9X3P8_9CAUD|nr:putative tail tip protein [Escherichia phage mckay]QHR73467.1 putative tail tip protein [Escherichia phage mckay]